MLGQNPSHSKLCLTYGVLQKRTKIVAIHIKNHLIALRKMFCTLDNKVSVLSVNSTRSLLHLTFGNVSPCTELGYLLACPDYGVADTSLFEAQDQLLQRLSIVPETFYSE